MAGAVSVVRLAQGLPNISTGRKKTGIGSVRTDFQYHFPPTVETQEAVIPQAWFWAA